MRPIFLKNLKLAIVWGVFAISLANASYGQWLKKCPQGGSANCFVKKGSDLFAGTFGGVYKSSDNGAIWTASNNGINILDIRSMVVTSSKIFVGSGGGIYCSSDGGASWILCGLANRRVYAMVESQNTIFASSSDGGIYKSVNGGTTWTYVGLVTEDIRSLHLAGNNIVAGAVGFDALYYSADNGISWQQSTAPYSNAVEFATSGTDIFGACTQGIIKSSDNGLTWSLTSNGLQNLPTETISANGGNLYAGSYGQGIFYSSDNGANWIRLNNGLSNLYVLGIFADAGKVFVGTFGGGIYTSTNNGTIWSKANTGFCGQAIVDLGSMDSSLFAATPNGVYKSTDRGETWIESNNGLANSSGNIHNVFSLAVSGQTLYAGTQNYGAFKSTDNGATWTAINNGLLISGQQDVISIKASGSTLFAGTYGWGIFRSTDGGNTWEQTVTGLAHQVVESIVFMGTDVYCSQWNGISKSTDNGNTWASVNLTAGVYQLAVSGNTIFAGGSGSIGVIKSNDGGQTWIPANNGITDLNINSLVANQNVIVAGTNSGVFISTDAGLNWTLSNDGFESPTPKVQSLIINNNDLIAGSLYQSVWKKSCGVAPILTRQNVSACDEYLFNGNVISLSGIYYDTLMAAGGCDSIVELILNIFPKPSPQLGKDTSICNGQLLTLSPGSFNNYFWNDGTTSNVLGVTAPGIYWVDVTDNNSCVSRDSITVSSGINCNNGICALTTETKLFPNPFGNRLIIDKNITSCVIKMNVYNSIGLLVMKDYILNDGVNDIDFSKFSSGVYFYKLHTNNQTLQTGKLIKMNY